ncbi:alpha-1,2-fucosyltransferase [Limnobacter litoralis]|uniref:Alpha-1,2-fucosyltransferase n=1 Tax=Limnobacter litoralis TaxID=481366 RepID=A0ABQ5YWZ0_9BURK|nr:alpha-1,2-fucosyltransferase [Limnobacter litoralis]GLR27017.1 alpha-1,2-fucosyltransferase [Limnobacter litoralis]
MIVVNLVGGLGNQMFQYACGKSLSIYTQQKLYVTVDQIERYNQHNGYELNRVFGLNLNIMPISTLRHIIGFKSVLNLRRIYAHPFLSWIQSTNFYAERSNQFDRKIFEQKPPLYLHGYWQSEDYFKDQENIIRNEFDFKTSINTEDFRILQKMREKPSVSIHVRRGDYLKGKFKRIYHICDANYYINAIKHFENIYSDFNIFAFSDDPEWVDVNLAKKFENLHIVSHNSGEFSCNDMRLMAAADHNIIANSSFSWWAAWLNSNDDKIVIAPKKWYRADKQANTIIPTRWISL